MALKVTSDTDGEVKEEVVSESTLAEQKTAFENDLVTLGESKQVLLKSIETLENDKVSILDQISTLRGVVTDLQTHKKDAESAFASTKEDIQKKIDDLNQKISELTEKKNSVQDEISNFQTTIKNLISSIDEKNGVLSSVNAQIERARVDHMDVSEKLENKSKELVAIENQISPKQSKIESLDAEIKDKKDKLEKLELDIKSAESEKAAVAIQKSEITALGKQKQDIQNEIALALKKLEETNEAITQRVAVATEAERKADVKIEELKTRIQNAKSDGYINERIKLGGTPT